MGIVVPAPFPAKLAPQRMPRGAIRRPALVEVLGEGSGATLTLICAPAGFGKTALLTEWVEAARTSTPATAFAWVTLYLLLSRVQYALGDTALALRSLDAADSILSRQRDPGALPDRARRLRQTVGTPLRAAGYGEALTERESEVLNLLAAGRSQREIANSLFISHNTVKTHLKSVYRKLGVTSRDAAVEQLASRGTAASQISPG